MFKVLIIDPNTFFRESLAKIINDHFAGVEIREAGSGAEGFERLNSFDPQLIFIDIHLPDRNGLDLAKKFKAFYPEAVISLFISFDSPEYQSAALDSGIEQLIPKSDWTSKDILQRVEALLGQRGIK